MRVWKFALSVLFTVITGHAYAAETPIEQCGANMVYTKAYESHSLETSFQYALKEYILTHDWSESSQNFGLGVTVPIDGIPVQFNVDKSKYNKAKSDLQSEHLEAMSAARSEFLLQEFQPNAAFDSYNHCLDIIRDIPIVCAFEPVPEQGDMSESTLYIRWGGMGSSSRVTAILDNTDGVRFSGLPAQRDLIKNGFPKTLLPTPTGQFFSVSRTASAMSKTQQVTVTAIYRQGGQDTSVSCSPILQAIPPEPDAPIYSADVWKPSPHWIGSGNNITVIPTYSRTIADWVNENCGTTDAYGIRGHIDVSGNNDWDEYLSCRVDGPDAVSSKFTWQLRLVSGSSTTAPVYLTESLRLAYIGRVEGNADTLHYLEQVAK
jgi:hypothetical protein